MNKQTATKTAPVTQKVKIIMSSILPQFEATGVHHHGLQKWNIIDATIISTNIIDTNIIYYFSLKFYAYFYNFFIFITIFYNVNAFK